MNNMLLLGHKKTIGATVGAWNKKDTSNQLWYFKTAPPTSRIGKAMAELCTDTEMPFYHIMC